MSVPFIVSLGSLSAQVLGKYDEVCILIYVQLIINIDDAKENRTRFTYYICSFK